MPMNWKKYFIASPITPEASFYCITVSIKIDNKTVYLKFDGSVKNWNI